MAGTMALRWRVIGIFERSCRPVRPSITGHSVHSSDRKLSRRIVKITNHDYGRKLNYLVRITRRISTTELTKSQRTFWKMMFCFWCLEVSFFVVTL